MKQFSRYILIGSAVALPFMAVARTYDTSNLPYSDAPSDRETQVALSVLTEEEILLGNPDGTFRPNNPLNRAEFMQIVMRLLPAGTVDLRKPCFPDVATNVWYAEPVCRAKELGIVRGNALPGVPASEWRFEPNRAVQYEEAVKVLVNIYALPTGEEESGVDMQWYVPFLEAAAEANVDIPDLRPGEEIRRGEMARLVANFYANSFGELEQLREAQGSSVSSSSRSSSSRTSSSSSSRTSSSSSSSSSSVTGTKDPLTDTNVRGSLMLLGETSSVLASARIFSNSEPILVDTFFVELMSANTSIDGFLVYDEDKMYLGRATRHPTDATRYELNVENDSITIPQRVEYTFYVRATTRDPDEGGVGGALVQVDSAGVVGSGEWSGTSYTQATTETFPVSQTADAAITSITNVGPANDPLVAGPGRVLGQFTFTGNEGAANAELRVTGLAFYLSTSGGVSVANPELRVQGVSDAHDCTLSSSVITCSSIPEGIGTIDDTAPLTITVYGDVTIPSNTSSASLQLTLIEPGSPTSAGAVTWTDGDTVFTWVGGESPVARGTYYSF